MNILESILSVESFDEVQQILETLSIDVVKQVVAECRNIVAIAKILDSCGEEQEEVLIYQIPEDLKFGVLRELDNKLIYLNYFTDEELQEFFAPMSQSEVSEYLLLLDEV